MSGFFSARDNDRVMVSESEPGPASLLAPQLSSTRFCSNKRQSSIFVLERRLAGCRNTTTARRLLDTHVEPAPFACDVGKGWATFDDDMERFSSASGGGLKKSFSNPDLSLSTILSSDLNVSPQHRRRSSNPDNIRMSTVSAASEVTWGSHDYSRHCSNPMLGSFASDDEDCLHDSSRSMTSSSRSAECNPYGFQDSSNRAYDDMVSSCNRLRLRAQHGKKKDTSKSGSEDKKKKKSASGTKGSRSLSPRRGRKEADDARLALEGSNGSLSASRVSNLSSSPRRGRKGPSDDQPSSPRRCRSRNGAQEGASSHKIKKSSSSPTLTALEAKKGRSGEAETLRSSSPSGHLRRSPEQSRRGRRRVKGGGSDSKNRSRSNPTLRRTRTDGKDQRRAGKTGPSQTPKANLCRSKTGGAQGSARAVQREIDKPSIGRSKSHQRADCNQAVQPSFGCSSSNPSALPLSSATTECDQRSAKSAERSDLAASLRSQVAADSDRRGAKSTVGSQVSPPKSRRKQSDQSPLLQSRTPQPAFRRNKSGPASLRLSPWASPTQQQKARRTSPGNRRRLRDNTRKAEAVPLLTDPAKSKFQSESSSEFFDRTLDEAIKSRYQVDQTTADSWIGKEEKEDSAMEEKRDYISGMSALAEATTGSTMMQTLNSMFSFGTSLGVGHDKKLELKNSTTSLTNAPVHGRVSQDARARSQARKLEGVLKTVKGEGDKPERVPSKTEVVRPSSGIKRCSSAPSLSKSLCPENQDRSMAEAKLERREARKLRRQKSRAQGEEPQSPTRERRRLGSRLAEKQSPGTRSPRKKSPGPGREGRSRNEDKEKEERARQLKALWNRSSTDKALMMPPLASGPQKLYFPKAG